MLTLLPTPIGNLGDITLRALQVLSESNILMCEDIRVSKKLLSLLKQNPIIEQHFNGIFEKKDFISFHSHNEKEFLSQVDKDFFVHNNIVFMSDAGMPCVSDPGIELVAYALKNNLAYDVLPGGSAAINAYCFSGLETEGFLFAGFLPHKQKERKQRLASLIDICSRIDQKFSIVMYESPHRILSSLQDIAAIAPNAHLFAIKEMTKMHQKYFLGKAQEVFAQVSSSNINGEWALVLLAQQDPQPFLLASQIEQMDIPPKIKAKMLAKLLGEDTKSIYEQISKKDIK